MNEHGNNNRNRPISGRRRARLSVAGDRTGGTLPVLRGLYADVSGWTMCWNVIRTADVPIRLTVSLPQSALPSRSARKSKRHPTRRKTGSRTMRILVFEQERTADMRIAIWWKRNKLQSSGTGVLFQAKLLSTPNPVKLMLVGNYGDAFAVYAPSPGRFGSPMSKPEQDARSRESATESAHVRSRSSFRPDWKPTGRTVTVSRCCVRQPGSMWRRTWRRIRGRYGSRASAYTVANDKIQIAPDEARR